MRKESGVKDVTNQLEVGDDRKCVRVMLIQKSVWMWAVHSCL